MVDLKTKKRVRDLTSGSVPGGLILFMLPLLGSSLIQQLYNTVDIMFIGQFLDKNASAAVGSGGLLITLLLGLFTGFSIGVGVIAAKAFGAGDATSLHQTVHTTAAVAVVCGSVFTVFSVDCTPAYLVILNVPLEIRQMSQLYLSIYFISLFAMVLFNLSAGILRALGDSRTPMLYQLYGGIGNVIADVVFIAVLGWGVGGAALASVCSQSVVALLTVHRLTKLDEGYKHCFFKFEVYPQKLKEIFVIGIPSAIQAMLITSSNLFVQANINTLDITSIAGYTVYFKVENFIYMPCGAFGQAAMTFVAQNVGAGQSLRARKGVAMSIAIGMAIALILEFIFLYFGSFIFSCFSSDGSVVLSGLSIARITFPFYFSYVFIEVFSGAIRGSGKAFAPMLIVLSTLGVARMVIVAFIMLSGGTAQTVAVAYPITWIMAAILLTVFYFAAKCITRSVKNAKA